MTEREEFEVHFGIPIEQRRSPSAGGYAQREFQMMWAGWQASRRTTPDREAWQPVETAPKGPSIQLWVPALGIFVDGPWRGRWSYVANQWVLDTPFCEPDGRGVSVSEIHNPTHWMPLPPAPNGEKG
ncbi:DUF551 domain-containing protein [Burkholderia cenocepacia]|uniref:DUF551 domain-containing protein n=1 Tax=Burkholderia cenocepacia TaxID=95486 RepID=A0A6B2MQH9_9BURK|nr:DUF551 domain-containing protein [Burkholderia cenocepacia]NDV77236.1 DUF551 domain-containing protein [Burkholderia cenocepacia]